MRLAPIAAGFFAASLLLATSCGMVDCVHGTGDVVVKELPIAAIHGIDVQGSVEVHVTRAEVQHVTAEGQANLIELLETNVADGIWTIRTSKCHITDKSFVVNISMPLLDHVHVQGSGDVTGIGTFDVENADVDVQGSSNVSLNLNAKTIEAEIQGSGDITLSGSAGGLTCAIQGSGNMKAFELTTQRTKADITGSGNVEVSVATALHVSLTGSGNVHYRGNPPEVRSDVTGSGNVEQVP